MAIPKIPKSPFALGTTPDALARQKTNTLAAIQQRGANNSPGYQQRLGNINYASGVMSNTNADALKAEEAKILANIQRRGGNAPNYQARLNVVRSQLRNINPNGVQITDPNAGAQPTPGVAATPSPEDLAAAKAKEDEINKFLFPDLNSNFDYMLNKGRDGLNRNLAASGLSGSGAAISGYNDLVAKLSNEQGQLANTYNQANAARGYDLFTGNLDRQDRNAQNDFANKLSLIQTALGQNPLQYGYGAANTTSNLTGDQAKNNANYDASNYQHVTSRGGGGGNKPFVPNFPSQPNLNMADLQGILNNNSKNTNMYNLFGSLLSGLSSGVK